MKRNLQTARIGEAVTSVSFIMPALVVIGLCMVLPIIIAFGLSFTHCSKFLTIRWAGIDNYLRVMSDPQSLKALWNTLFFALVYVPFNLVLSLGIAMLLNQRFPFIRVIRSVYFVPVAVSGVVAASIFKFIFDQTSGPVNAVLSVFGYDPIPWLWHARYAMWTIIIITLWKSVAFFSIILLAALQEVPEELSEAATVDGAGPLARFLHVTLPSIRPVVVTTILLSSIGAFRVFEPMFVLTKGGPADSTRTISLLAYDAAFGSGEIGYANAISFVLLTIILAVTWLINRFMEPRDEKK